MHRLTYFITMFSLKHFLLAAGVSTAICATVLFFPRCENPRELALGDWKGANTPLMAEVTEDSVQWSAPGARGRFSYTWEQDRKSPYRVSFRRGQTVVKVDVCFDGDDMVLVEPLVFEKLPAVLQQHLRSRNKLLGRPETEIKLSFRRVKPKKK